MADVARQAKNLKLKYLKSRNLTTDLFNQIIDLILATRDFNETTDITADEIRDKLQSLVGPNRLRSDAIKDLEIPLGVGKMTPIEIRNALQTLVGDARLSAESLSNNTSNLVQFNSPDTPNVNNVEEAIIFLLNNFSKYEPDLGLPDEDGQALTSLKDGTRQWKTIETDKNYTYVRLEPSIEWEFSHPLNKIPSVEILNEHNKKIYGAVDLLTENTVRVKFNTPQIGSIELN